MASGQFAVDPAIIAPHYFPDDVSFEKYVQAISNFSKIETPVIIDAALIEFLIASGLYPLRPSIENLIIRHKADYIDADSLARIINKLITESVSFDDEILYEREFLEATFPESCTCHPELDVHLTNLLEYLCVLYSISGTIIQLFGIPRAQCEFLAVEYRFSEVIVGDDNLDDLGSGVVRFVPVSTLGGIEETQSFREKWIDSGCSKDSLLPSIKEFLKSKQVASSKIENLHIGPDFFKDLKNYDIISSDKIFNKVLLAIFEIVSGEQLWKTHALRESSGGGSKAKVCDGFSALRHDVTRDFHLHYWKGSGSVIELSNVGHHDSFLISAKSWI